MRTPSIGELVKVYDYAGTWHGRVLCVAEVMESRHIDRLGYVVRVRQPDGVEVWVDMDRVAPA